MQRQPLLSRPETTVHRDDAIPTFDEAEKTVVESKAQIVEYLESGCKPLGDGQNSEDLMASWSTLSRF
jgi:hypothetical protein